MSNNYLSQFLKDLGKEKKQPVAKALDDVSNQGEQPPVDPNAVPPNGGEAIGGGAVTEDNPENTPAIMDDAGDGGAIVDAPVVVTSDDDGDIRDYADADLSLRVAGAIHAWAETDAGDLDDGENLADRLQALMIGVVDPDFNGDIDDDEADVIAAAMETAGDYLADKGVSEDDISALLNDGDADAADRVQELVASKLPSDGDGIADDIDSFAFDGDDGEDDSALDATVTVVRAGKKMRIKKRLSGRARLTSKQKIAIKKMQKKSHSAKAQNRRLKSLKVRARMMPEKK